MSTLSSSQRMHAYVCKTQLLDFVSGVGIVVHCVKYKYQRKSLKLCLTGTVLEPELHQTLHFIDTKFVEKVTM